MTNKSQKPRRINQKNKINGTFACSICLVDEKTRMITLACEHQFHYDCINKWFNAEIIRWSSDDGGIGVFSPLENKKIQLNDDDKLLFKCPVCRCEYTMNTPASMGTFCGLMEFKKVLAKIIFDKGVYNKIQHYISDMSDLLLYVSKRKVLKQHKAVTETNAAVHLSNLAIGAFLGYTELFIYECIDCKRIEP